MFVSASASVSGLSLLVCLSDILIALSGVVGSSRLRGLRCSLAGDLGEQRTSGTRLSMVYKFMSLRRVGV